MKTDSSRASGADSADYVPRLDPAVWADIESFVVASVDAVEPLVAYSRETLLTALAHHVGWVRMHLGPTLDASHVYSRIMIGASVAAMKPATASTMGRRRSILLRVSEALGIVDRPSTLPQLAASSGTTPYSEVERARLRTWAHLQGKAETRASLRALLALGFGAGLLTRELCEVRACDVAVEGCAVRVLGERARIVPVAAVWRKELAELAAGAPDAEDSLFRRGVAYTKNTVVDLVRRAQGGSTVTTQRMRASWIVDRLVEGTPMQELVTAAGVRSLDAFVRYEQYLPRPAEIRFEQARA
ncbi:hypothetical protein [Microbacterium sp. NPDC096154]|uniref:hypothetical protein n=1 Tax=Microbacterium sp. NPDC096154 TaxID=3155549 RepID=UPI003334132E